MPKLISNSLFHRTLNGFEMVKCRENIGLTQKQFADECEWSQQYQQQLEAIGMHEIPKHTAQKIQAILKKHTSI